MNRIWELTHDGTCESFSRAWRNAETNELSDWYDLMKDMAPDVAARVIKSPEGPYVLDGLDVSISDMTVLILSRLQALNF